MSVPGCTGPAEGFDQTRTELEQEIGRKTAGPRVQHNAAIKVIQLAERAQDVIEVTELEPNDGTFIGKHVNRDGSLTEYPRVTWWRQNVAHVPATIPHLFAYLREARKRNICLIRGAPANPERQPTRRQNAGVAGSSDRGDHGFADTPTRLFFLDVDGMQIDWRADPERAIQNLVGLLGEPWASTSFVWFFSAKHGLEFIELDGCKRWTGKIIDGKLYARIVFITERALNAAEAGALTNIAKVFVPKLDTSISRQVQPNYIARPHWVEHPNRDVLGDIPTIGCVKGTSDYLTVPEDLTYTAHWAKAQGHGTDVADHPDAESAVRGISSDGRVRQHLKAAVEHLLRTNPVPEVVSFADHSLDIASRIQGMVEQHREQIAGNLVSHARRWSEVHEYLSKMSDYALWCLNRQAVLKRKTIKLAKQEQPKTQNQATREAIFARVERTIVRACVKALTNKGSEPPPVTLLVAPTGSRKSTAVRAAAVIYVTEHPDKTVVILVPRHKLGDEQIDRLRSEHAGGDYSAAVWRGRHADDPETRMKMCQRAPAAAAVEEAMINVEHSLCKQGRGDKAIKCPHFDICAYQRQKQTRANIWFAAHECAAHEMPKAFGDVGWVIFDESPLDAFMFGVDINDQVMLGLDMLRTPLPGGRSKFGGGFDRLIQGRATLYHALDQLRVPTEFHQGAAIPLQSLTPFIEKSLWRRARDMRRFTFRGKVDPKIRPDMSDEQLKTKLQEAVGNDTIKKEVTLWEQVEAAKNNTIDDILEKEVTPQELIQLIENNRRYGRIQIHRGKAGRVIRMVGLKLPAKEKLLAEGERAARETLPAKGKTLAKGWNVPTLICDATGDAELLKAIWPQLEEPEPHGWQQLPRPVNVRIFQCVNRTISKWAVAVDGKNPKELERKTEGARRLYAALLMKALEYDGQDVGVIVYKSTKDWIQKNCFVPEWLKILHWGDVTGTNTLQKVRALIVIGRPLASPEDIARQAEALFGAYIPQRDYVVRRKQGRIPTIPDAAGNNCILVDVREHPHPMGERVRRQITEGSLIQAAGRARAGLRKQDEPLDIHLWTDVPVPELGPVEPVLWGELEAGLDGLMLAAEGSWLSNIADAVRAFKGLFSAGGLDNARRRGVRLLHIGIPICKRRSPPVFRVIYRRTGAGCKPARAVFLRGVGNPRAWLEQRLGPLAYFEIEAEAAAVQQ